MALPLAVEGQFVCVVELRPCDRLGIAVTVVVIEEFTPFFLCEEAPAEHVGCCFTVVERHIEEILTMFNRVVGDPG